MDSDKQTVQGITIHEAAQRWNEIILVLEAVGISGDLVTLAALKFGVAHVEQVMGIELREANSRQQTARKPRIGFGG